MSKAVLAVVIAVMIAVAGIAGYLTLNRSNTTSPNATRNTSEESSQHDEAHSLRELLGLGTNLECTFSDQETGSNGTVYVGGESQMRGDFTSVADTQTVNGHIMVDGDNMYLWTDGETQGFKASLSASQELAEQSIGIGAFDVNKDVDYECHNWAPDNSKFTLPSNVEFQDFSAMMESMGEMMEQSGDGKTGDINQCAICDSLPAEAQAQCKQALDC